MTDRPALLLIDVQQDYLSRAGLLPDKAVLETALAALLNAAREQHWPVLHVQTRVAADSSDAMPHWKDAGRVACLGASPGAEPPASLAPQSGEKVFFKRFYSGFEDPQLLAHLHKIGVDNLIVAGLYTHACVRSTILDAYAHGFTVFLATDCVASYDPEHSDLTLEWLGSRAATCLPMVDILAKFSHAPRSMRAVGKPTWLHRNPADWSTILGEVKLSRESEIASTVERVTLHRHKWRTVPLSERAARLAAWRSSLSQNQDRWVDLLIREVAKPRTDAEAEVRYGLALLDDVCLQLGADEATQSGRVRYRPHGLVGLITPWNNPFAIPIGKIAPALGYGNGVVWKPALPASGLSQALHESLAQVGLDQAVGLVTGDALSGHLLVQAADVGAISFTGSVSAGRQLARRCGRLMRPLQAELGGNNAAIVLADADLNAVAQELALAMFSFAGQRCTAIRRLIVAREVFVSFAEALRAAVEALNVGSPSESGTHIGPVISKMRQTELLAAAQAAVASGARLLTGGSVPKHCPEVGCWIAPTVLTDLAPDSSIAREEMFGPVVALMSAADVEQAIALHNQVEHGLLGALFSRDQACQARFLAEAQAGILVVNQARPAFAGSGPFVGWKASGYGPPEHGRWNREFYTRVQAVYANA